MSGQSSTTIIKISTAAGIFLFLSLFLFNHLARAEGLQGLISSPLSRQQAGQQAFIPVEEAFQLSGEIRDNQALIHFTVTPGHYLYKKRFSFIARHSETILGEPAWPSGKEKFDENFGEVLEVFDQTITIQLPVSSSQEIPEIDVRFQGCAEAGLCYPPHTQTLALATSDGSLVPVSTISTSDLTSADISDSDSNDDSNSYMNSYESTISEKGFIASLLLFLLAGIGLTFTPCVLPMVPILSSILVGNSTASRPKIISLTLTYILSMSLTFAVAGTLMGLFGASLNLQAKLQSPWLLGPFAALFVLLALSMFGLYELQLPEKLRNKLGNSDQSQGKLSGAMMMGVLSALVVSPCVSAPLAGALIYIGTTGDALLGGLSLFALGLGMGLPLLLIGIGGRHLLPKAGQWMDSVKIFFGFLLLAVAIWMLERVIPGPVTLLLWGSLFTGCGVRLGAMNLQPKKNWAIASQALGIIFLVYGGCLIVGAARGNTDPLQPLAATVSTDPASTTTPANSRLVFTKTHSVTELNELLQQATLQELPVMVDVYADWCLSCKVMERTVFPDPDVRPLLEQLQLLKLDITDNTEHHQTWLNNYQLFGPPALLFFDPSGQEISHIRTLGEIQAPALASKLKKLLSDQ
ncbi:protein-disulfide reductase DsbD [Endozoicomonas euniceicola]|uniref:Thiol:disulfide interchange protein DsbD n=1 Tax=Endozoicomonas euniceicola TaxID=1234143 RepID=A0ABY6GRE2_9GAMM|nr:protein-disulfide reductase DsbD [Endozoicomonas euniceicola]UYM14711.1 protein-disulfide reductase DsbD [Endozoicomonas euniceicola]